MQEHTQEYQLIVRQQPSTHPGLEALLSVLKDEHGLDAYTARHHLAGSGKALFDKGGKETLERLATLLRGHGYPCWVVRRSEGAAPPRRLRDLNIKPQRVEFITPQESLILEQGDTVVAVLGDLSGQLEERALRRYMTQRNYRDAADIAAMSDADMVQAVLRGKPVLDLYLFDAQLAPKGGVRVLPGRFNARSLGGRMSLSALLNLEAVLELARDYAGRFSLHADFGLGRLPECRVRDLDGKTVAEGKALEGLTRYGALMCDLEQDRPVRGAAVAGMAAAPVAAVAAALADAEAPVGEEPPGGAAEVRSPWLPAPPEPGVTRFSLHKLLPVVVGLLIGIGFAVFSEGGRPARFLATYGFKTGLIPALAALGLFWGGFHCVRLKRSIENTPTSRIRSLAMGLVEVYGRALRSYALVSPMTQSPCVFYRLRRYRKDSRNRWQLESDRDSCHVPFMIDDGTGRVLVDPLGATVQARTSRTGYPGEATLVFDGVADDDRREKWVEEVILEGTSLYVLGFASPRRAERLSLRERTAARLRQLKLDRKALHRYDADGDGRISAEEWTVARGDAERAALDEQLAENGSARRQEEHAVIARPPRGLPFVVAETLSEAALVRKYWLLSFPLLLAALAAAGGALYLLVKFIGS